MKNHKDPGTRVLLVEDEPLTVEAPASILELEGYEIEAAYDGSTGLDMLRSAPPPRIVLLDLDLPMISGREFLRRQKGDPQIADIPVIVITGSSSPLAPGASAVLSKPVDVPKLLELMADYCH
jgi:CheY-like chemotaxis protein